MKKTLTKVKNDNILDCVGAKMLEHVLAAVQWLQNVSLSTSCTMFCRQINLLVRKWTDSFCIIARMVDYLHLLEFHVQIQSRSSVPVFDPFNVMVPTNVQCTISNRHDLENVSNSVGALIITTYHVESWS